MADGNTNFPYDSVESSLNMVRSYAPEEGELTLFSDAVDTLTPISQKHDDYLASFLEQISSGGSLNNGLKTVNEEYNKLINNASNAVNLMKNADSDGKVDLPAGTGGLPDGGSPGGSGGYSPSGSTPPELSTSQNRQTTPSSPSYTPGDGSNNYPTNTPGDLSVGNTSGTGTNPGAIGGGTTPNGSNGSSVAAGTVGAGVAGAISGLSDSEVGGKGAVNGEGGSVFGDNPLGNYMPESSTWDNLPEDVQNEIINKLQNLGYSDEQIQSIINGNEPVPQVAIDALSDTLADAVADHPELRDLIKQQYGIDIFNEDGSVNKDKLAIALYMDEARDGDGFDLIGLLHDKYNIDLVDSNVLNDMSSKLLDALNKNSDIRNLIIQKYGFDIFNDDGTINNNKLILALLMDKKSATDGYDLSQTILDLFGNGYSLDDIVSSVIRPNLDKDVKSGSFAALPLSIALGLGATASTVGGGMKYVKDKKKKDKEKEEIKTEDEIEEAEFLDSVKPKKAKDKDDMSWLLGLGLGIGAAAATKKAKDEMEKKKKEKESKEKELKKEKTEVKPEDDFFML